MEWHAYVFIIFGLGGAFFISAIATLWWAARKGHLTNLEATSRSIFTEDEPEGQRTDFFPSKKPSPIEETLSV